MNDTFKIKKHIYFHSSSVIFSSMCSYFSAMSWMILPKDLDRSRYVTNSRKWTTLLKSKNVSTVLLSSLVLCTHIIHDIAEKYERIELKMTEEPSKRVFFILKVSFISRNIFKVALQSTLQGFGYYICINNFSLVKFLSQSTR